MDMAQKQYTAQTRSVLIQQQMLDQQRKATADDNPSMPTEWRNRGAATAASRETPGPPCRKPRLY